MTRNARARLGGTGRLQAAADELYAPLNRRQRLALLVAYDRALLGSHTGELARRPELPVWTHPLTARALTRRGLVAEGALTPLGVEVVRWAAPLHELRRTVVTAHVIGEPL